MICEKCNKEFVLSQTARCERNRKNTPLSLCRECLVCGPGNHAWRGGHKHWTVGRFGKDKDGLSWKTQRRLAWKRDDETCQHCLKVKVRRPDVHHIVPFRVSQSHSLSNLLCLCQSCHLIEEAKIQDEWGGQLLKSKPRRPHCADCNRVIVYTRRVRETPDGIVCSSCFKLSLVKKAQVLHQNGVTEREISQLLGISMGSAHYYANGVQSAHSKLPVNGSNLVAEAVLEEGPTGS